MHALHDDSPGDVVVHPIACDRKHGRILRVDLAASGHYFMSSSLLWLFDRCDVACCSEDAVPVLARSGHHDTPLALIWVPVEEFHASRCLCFVLREDQIYFRLSQASSCSTCSQNGFSSIVSHPSSSARALRRGGLTSSRGRIACT